MELTFIVFLFMSCLPLTIFSEQPQLFFTLMKRSLSGNQYFSTWDEKSSPCNYTGVGCDKHGYVTTIDVSGWSLSGQFPAGVCSYLPALRMLRLNHNRLTGKFPDGIANCSLLTALNMSSNHLTGKLPNFSPMRSLQVLDLSYNMFTGDFPTSVANLTELEKLELNENLGFSFWQLPPEGFPMLKKLKTLILTTCMLEGEIPPSIGNMTSLTNLQLSGNDLVGKIPKELGRLTNLELLELYYNHFMGGIPEELGNLTGLVDLDMSVNYLTGEIPESICGLPNLRVLQLYNNSLTGEIPSVIENSTTLQILSLYTNSLTGRVPPGLGRSSPMTAFDLSENNLSGELPPEVCKGGNLQYLLLLENMFSGEIPKSYGECQSLVRFRVSNNMLEGSIPRGLLGLLHVSILDLGFNNLSGPIAETIGNARNLSELFIPGNRVSGVLPPEISNARSLVKIDLSNNRLSGEVPPEIGKLRMLNLLLLQGNKLNSSIPESLSLLKSLNFLDLSSNCLTGNIPRSLSELLPNSINFSNNQLSGPIPLSLVKEGLLESFSGNPGLCLPVYLNSSTPNLPLCSHASTRKQISFFWAIGFSVAFSMIGLVLCISRRLSKRRALMEHGPAFSSLFCSYDVKSFHRMSFDHRKIVQGMVEKNIVGHGGSGIVYRIELNKGEVVAVKKLWNRKKTTNSLPTDDNWVLDKELKTEVDTLACIRHRSIIKLYSYLSNTECSLLVYEYMPNGNLWDALHGQRELLDWPTRHWIAVGVAQGLAYLHHDLPLPIIHRDIKSTNILLDVKNEAKVADFGIAKVLHARGRDSTTTVVAGTYGYLAPEYAYSSKATTKCDVYSFGVVLLELLTGKKPVEPEFGENKNITYWVSCKVDTKGGILEVLDKQLSRAFRDEMIQALRIAMRCTCSNPALRPTMKEAVQMLCNAGPSR